MTTRPFGSGPHPSAATLAEALAWLEMLRPRPGAVPRHWAADTFDPWRDTGDPYREPLELVR